MSISTYRDLAIAQLPWAWRGTTAYRLMYSIGMAADAVFEALFAAVMMRFPGKYSAASLGQCGRDRFVFRGVAETDASYAERCIDWLTPMQLAGCPWVTLEQLAHYFTGYDVIVDGIQCIGADGAALRFRIAADGTKSVDALEWLWDGDIAANPSRYWIILHVPTTLADDLPTWTGSSWSGSSELVDCTVMPFEVAESIRSIVSFYNPPNASCDCIIVIWDEAAWTWPDGTWDKHSTRNETAAYFKATEL